MALDESATASRHRITRANLRKKPLPSVPSTTLCHSHSVKSDGSIKDAVAAVYQLVPPAAGTPQAPPTSWWTRTRHFCSRTWAWEIVAIVLSLSCMTSIIGVLIYEQDKPLSQWSLRVSPSAVVSFLASLCKASLMVAVVEIISQYKWLFFASEPQKTSDLQLFDEASRGPWGSAKFFLLKHVKMLPVSLAALITVAALFVEPAVQLVLAFPTALRPAPGQSALFSTTNVYDPTHIPSNSYYTPLAALTDITMQGSIYKGLYGGTLPEGTSCPTSECTWSNVTTLGVCSSCDDLTSQVHTTCTKNDPSIPGQTCTYQLGSSASFQGSVAVVGTAIDKHKQQSVWNSTAVNLAKKVVNQSDVPELAGFIAVQFPVNGNFRQDVNSVMPPAKAMACGFLLCAKTYETVRFDNSTTTLSPAVETKMLLNEHVAFGDYWPMVTMISNPSSPWAPSRNFTINYEDFINIGEYLSQMFTTASAFDGQGLVNFSRNGIDASPALSYAANVTALIANVSESMTGTMRTSPNATEAKGTALIPTTIIRVQFGWLALPITLIFATAVLLGIIIWESRREQSPLWRSSSLAMLVHQLDGYDEDQLSKMHGARNVFELERDLEGTGVSLDRDRQSGMRFIKNE